MLPSRLLLLTSLAAALLLPATAAGRGQVDLSPAREAGGWHGRNWADPDHDGLQTWAELHRVGTNPRKFDTDGDGVGDGAEVLAGSNPRSRASVPRPAQVIDATPAPSEVRVPPLAPAPPPGPTTPDTWITSGPSGTISSTRISFAFSSNESDTTFLCQIDSGPWMPCSAPQSYRVTGFDTHTFSVAALDAEGHTDPTPATQSWTLQSPQSPGDTTPPETTISGGTSGTTSSTNASFEFTSSESGSSFQCSLDGGSWGSCASPKSYGAVAVGSHTFSVKATDGAGNTDATPATRSWTVQAAQPPVDTTPPETSINLGPLGTTTSTSASFGFGSSESGSTFQCKVDSEPWGSCSSPKSYGAVAVGSHTFSVKATDGAGNTDATPATRSWTVVESVACTSTLSPGANVSSALSSVAGGSVICLQEGSYSSVSTSGAHKSPPVTLRSAPADRASVNGINLIDPSGLRFEDLDLTAGISITPSASGIQIVDNDITGNSGIYFFGDYRIGDQVNNVLIEGNNIHDLDYTGTQETGYGYGIEGVGDARNVTVRNNTIKSTASDYIQSASPVGWLVDGNTFLGPSLLGSHEDHQDLWQIFGGGEDIAFTNNVARNTQTQESLLFQEGAFHNVTVENNLFDHDSRGYTCQIYQSTGLVFRRNTVVGSHWGCLFRDLSTSSPGSGYEVDHNVFADTEASTDVSTEGRAGDWGAYDYNVSSDNSASGSHSVRNWSPAWADTVNYGPLGLPFTAGYGP